MVTQLDISLKQNLTSITFLEGVTQPCLTTYSDWELVNS